MNIKLKPAVHYNGRLSFEASDSLTNVIANLQGRVVRLLSGLFCILIYWSFRLFRISGTLNPVYLLTQVFVLAIAIWVGYYQVNRVRSAVVTVGNQVLITDELISITTFTFDLFFWTKRPTKHVEFKIDQLKIRKTNNPLRFTWAMDNRVFELRDKEKEAYIVFDYFDKALEERLMEILVKVTPPELLLPGRLRRY